MTATILAELEGLRDAARNAQRKWEETPFNGDPKSNATTAMKKAEYALHWALDENADILLASLRRCVEAEGSANAVEATWQALLLQCAADPSKARRLVLVSREDVSAALAAAKLKETHQSSAATRDIIAERRRQVEVEGWTPEHDDTHAKGEMAIAAACYAVPGAIEWGSWVYRARRVLKWPWERKWWKPKDRRRDLVRAGALIIAEIERLDRAAAKLKEGAP